LKIINCHFLVASKSTVLKGLCQSDLFVKTKTKKNKNKKKKKIVLFPSDHNDFKGYNCLRGNNLEIINLLAHSIFFSGNRAFVIVDLPLSVSHQHHHHQSDGGDG